MPLESICLNSFFRCFSKTFFKWMFKHLSFFEILLFLLLRQILTGLKRLTFYLAMLLWWLAKNKLFCAIWTYYLSSNLSSLLFCKSSVSHLGIAAKRKNHFAKILRKISPLIRNFSFNLFLEKYEILAK